MNKAGSKVKVLFVTTEYAPFSSGGVWGFVAGSLAPARRLAGLDVGVVTTAWPGVLDKVSASGLKTTVLPERVCAAHDWRVHEAEIVKAEVADVPVYFLRGEDYKGDMYPWRLDFHTASPFAVFCMQALELFRSVKWTPDLYHCHDWTSAFLPCALAWHRHYRHVGGRSVITLHNVAYQGLLEREPFMEASGLEPWSFNMEAMEFYGQINLLKGAIVSANAVTTVSPSYAREIQTYESTRELSGVIYKQRHKLSGILNGIDTGYWNPETDPHIPEKFSAQKLNGKMRAREELMRRAGFQPHSPEPVAVCVSRLVEQKGFSLILSALDALPELGAKFVFLGSGHSWIEDALQKAGERWPDTVRFFQGYDEPLSHLLYAGGDVFLMPSVFEPCGLSQMIAMRYGTIPLVREVGGLRDTVTDVDSPKGGNGFTFQTCDTAGMLWALRRAIARFGEVKAWNEIRVRAMREDFTWNRSALLYKALYEKTLR